MDIKKTVGKRVQEFRKQKGLTQEQLAETIGIDTISLSKIETGRNYPTAENISKIAEALEVNVYEFFIFDNIKTNDELKKEIDQNLAKIIKSNQKLHVVSAVLKSLI